MTLEPLSLRPQEDSQNSCRRLWIENGHDPTNASNDDVDDFETDTYYVEWETEGLSTLSFSTGTTSDCNKLKYTVSSIVKRNACTVVTEARVQTIHKRNHLYGTCTAEFMLENSRVSEEQAPHPHAQIWVHVTHD